jgi:hypothetical protein
VHRDGLRRRRNRSDGRKTLEGIVGDFRLDRRLHHKILVHDQERVTVGRGARRCCGADGATGTGQVLHEELRSSCIEKLLRHDPADDIGRRTGRIRHDDLDRPNWIALGYRRLLRCKLQGNYQRPQQQ